MRLVLQILYDQKSKEAIKKFKNMGVQCMMITGDRKEVAKWVSDEIGLDKYYAEVLLRKRQIKSGRSNLKD